jgi:hypothetical protein
MLIAKKIIIPLILFLIFLCDLSFAEVKSVQGMGEAAIVGITPEEGWNLAIRRARADAIEQAAGVHVLGSTLVKDFVLAADFIKSFTRGFIVGEKISKKQCFFDKNTIPPIPHYKVVIQARVFIPEKQKENVNQFRVRLNKTIFTNGEKAVIEITPYNDLYIGIFNITADDRVIMLCPNQYLSHKKVMSGNAIKFPALDSALELVIQTLEGHKQDTEAFLIVGVPAKYKDIFERFKHKESFKLTEFFSIYSEVAGLASEEIIPYQVIKTE